MPLRNRLLFHIMPTDDQKKLSKHVLKRQNVRTKKVQTDSWLIEIYHLKNQPNY